MFFITTENENTSNIFTTLLLNVYLTYVTLGVIFSFFETVSFTMMICMAVDIDLTNVTQPEFGPPIFHINMNVVKKRNKKQGGFVPPKVERDLNKVVPKLDEEGEELEPEFNIKNHNDVALTGNNSDHENLF